MSRTAIPQGASTPAVVVGAGRVGRVLHSFSPTSVQIQRGDVLEDKLQGLPACPILVCTTNNALESVIRQTPKSRLKDLVFMQNGMLLPLLTRYGVQSNTQALLYLSATEDGAFTDGKRTVVTGRWADSVCSLLNHGGLTCRKITRDEYAPLMVEKLLWSSIFWLLSSALGRASVGHIASDHRGAVEQLVQELLPIATNYLSSLPSHRNQQQLIPGAGENRLVNTQMLQMDDLAVTEALLGYSHSIAAAVPSKEMACAEFEWRNGWFLAQKKSALHQHWLHQVGVL